jgi:hypothetical protein
MIIDRYALGVIGLSSLLCACSNPAGTVAPATSDSVRRLTHEQTFTYTGATQTFRVPSNVSWITVVARGAAGGGSNAGRGARVHAMLPVLPLEYLIVNVGGTSDSAMGGFNGGGGSGSSSCEDPGYGGGGASDLRLGQGRETRLLVAAGGGGEGRERLTGNFGSGGAGGRVGKSGGRGDYGINGGRGGSGATQKHGGAGGAAGAGGGDPGKAGASASGGEAGCGQRISGGGGGGGGGYYGGGGGGGGGTGNSGYGGGGGGGGGSSYVKPNAKSAKIWSGWKNATGDGLVVISW